MTSTPFFDVPKHKRDTSQGSVELPIAYYDNSNLIAVFSADARALEDKLSGLGLSPVLVRGKAQVALVFFEYAGSSIGAYNEVGLAALVSRSGTALPAVPMLDMLRDPRKRSVGAYVMNLPVTTDAANAAGRELWGYPKFVTKIPIRWAGRTFHGEVRDPQDDGLLLELSGRRSLGVPIPATGLLTFSRLDATDLDTLVDVRGRSVLAGGGSLRLRVGASSHAMAQNLRELGLDGQTPSLVVSTMHSASLLYAGVPSQATAHVGS